MFWADRNVAEIEGTFGDKIRSGGKLIIRDEKTASGRVHVGSMRGVAIHGVVSEILTEKNIKHSFLYEINDMDPMDGLPVYLDQEKFRPHMGKPLCNVPSPDNEAKNFAEYFAREFEQVITEAGYRPEFYRISELYLSGKMDGVIKEALEHAADIRRIYLEVSGSKKAEDWYPLSVICENCGKVGTTKVYAWDGKEVSYRCEKDAVKWAEGCGQEGKVSPFGGKAKLPFKVEWPAKWKVVGVDVEGGGKDHTTKGGTRDVASHIAREVFDIEPPFDMPYEFLLIAGKKMSSSKGAGASAKEISDILPPTIFRLALIGKDIKQQINFDPEGDTVPVLFDTYDKLAEGYFKGVEDDYSRLFSLIHLEGDRKSLKQSFLPRFREIAFLVQMPHINLENEVVKMKGGELTQDDKKELELRVHYAKLWLERYASEEFKYEIQKTLPEVAKNISEEQKKVLRSVLEFIESKNILDGLELHTSLHELRKNSGLEPKDFFGPIYLSILGKDHGPKAGWFLSVLDREFLIKRLKEVSK